ncbi:MAG: non-ribosomal peptide synthetase [Gordonia sp. (in: high G+C Gram-positive bacteria)]|uniref:non-ribosomal peptide synthetase n=1 Tax=Gordonia sp. (in: high G+C Gram-positive bacteria) TaxID=84139 RepID=UPI0039E36E0D
MTTHPSESFHRPISATEHLYLAGRSIAPPFAMQLAVIGDDRVDVEALRDAVAVAAEACPGIRLVRSGDSWVDSGFAPPVRLLGRGVDPDTLVDDEVLESPFGGGAHTVEVVVADDGERSTILFRAFHGVVDGKGLTMWVSDVFRALRGEEPAGAPDTDADADLVRRIGTGARATTLLPTRRGPVGATGPTGGGPEFVWRRRSVRGRPQASVARVCARLAEQIDGTARFMVPVDLRRHDPELRSTANLSLPLFVDVTGGTPWRRVQAQILSKMVAGRELAEMDNGGLTRFPEAVTRGLLTTADRVGRRTDRNLVSAIVSHAGRIDPEEVSAPGFTARRVLMFPVHTGLVPLTVALFDSGEYTEIVVSSRGGRQVTARVDAMLGRLDAALSEGSPAAGSVDAMPVPALPVVERPADFESIDEAFSAMAARHPEAVAVDGPEGSYSYSALDAWVESLAAALSDRGVTAGSAVSVLDRRTPASVAAQMAILRLGATIVPLDPKHPDARLTAILDDSGTQLLLVGRGVTAPAGTTVASVPIDDLPDAVTPASTARTVPGDRAAFITYTSGSTGRPKGVPVPHRGVVNYVAAATEWYRLGPETRFAHHHTPGADMAYAAVFSPLMTGGTVVLIPDDVSHLMLQGMLADANTYLFPPSLMETALRLDLDPVPARTVILGGERLSYGLARRVRDFFGPDTWIVNSYGPTEASIVCTSSMVGRDPAGHDDAAGVPIGAPSPNTPVFVLDDRQRPVPEGEAGELCFGGPQVALGYLGRPDLTAERFVTLPGGELVYRTGDLGTVRDGELVFVGRADEQVKVRGNRVEPDEVRTVIEEHDGVARAAVAGRPTRTGGRALVGYLVPAEGAELTVDDVRAHLAARVPSYMVPTTIHLIDEVPLSANGKLDVQRLPGVDDEAPIVAAPADAAPAPNDTAEAVRAVWADVLKVPAGSIGPDTDFFALGGDSLDSLEMLSRVAKSIVGAAGESRFVAQLEGLAADLTLSRVCDAVTTTARGALR